MRVAVHLLFIALVLGLAGCGPATAQSTLDLPLSKLPRATSQERSATLYRVRAAWDLRPSEVSAQGRKAEHMFINRFSSLARKMVGTEAATPAARLWRKIIEDHQRRYPD